MKSYVLIGLVLSVIVCCQAKPLETNDADIAIGVNVTTTMSTTQISNSRTYFKETFHTAGPDDTEPTLRKNTYRVGNETFINNSNDYFTEYDSEAELARVDTDESFNDPTQKITLYW
uniref:Uncharacterized protein n=1 Tax=Cacopsylla melanoneura TaxID=428564 RepID=A0A8D8Q7Q4_9HEMI